MKYDLIKELSEEQFRRLTGVKKTTLKRRRLMEDVKEMEFVLFMKICPRPYSRGQDAIIISEGLLSG